MHVHVHVHVHAHRHTHTESVLLYNDSNTKCRGQNFEVFLHRCSPTPFSLGAQPSPSSPCSPVPGPGALLLPPNLRHQALDPTQVRPCLCSIPSLVKGSHLSVWFPQQTNKQQHTQKPPLISLFPHLCIEFLSEGPVLLSKQNQSPIPATTAVVQVLASWAELLQPPLTHPTASASPLVSLLNTAITAALPKQALCHCSA